MYINKFNPMALLVFLSLLFTQHSLADAASVQLDADVDAAIQKFEKEIQGGAAFLPKVQGYLVFPSVIKAGLIIGGKYGKGALRINGQTKNYYSLTSASIGLQAGAQEHSMLIAFISETALNSFMVSNGWEAGVDGSIAISDWGKSKDLSSISFEKPIVAFIYGEQGLMASVSIAGTKFQKIVP